MKIVDFADVSSGYAFRGAINHDPNGEMYVLQPKDINMGEYISETTKFATVNSSSVKKPTFLQKNDIVIAARGRGVGSFKSALFKSDISNVIPSSSLLILRIKDNNIIPDYVLSYLNSNEGQFEILKHVAKGVFQTLLRRNLAEVAVPIPNLQTQKIIAGLSQNIYLQDYLNSRLMTVRRNLMNNILSSVAVV